MINQKVRLDKVCRITMGQAPSGESYNFDGQGLALIAGAGDFGRATPEPKKFTTEAGKKSEKGEIILCIRATIGDLNWSDKEYCLGRGVAGLFGHPDKLDQNFLWHWLKKNAELLKSKGKGATFLQVTKEDISSLEIFLPPLEEQRRIASILDKADAIREKRQQAIVKLDELLQATFIDMFGDPVSNPKKLKLQKLSEVGNISTGNTPSRADEDNYGDFIEWIKSDNLNHDYDIATQASEYLSEKGKKKGRVVPSGSILVTCIAGSLSCIGNLAIVDREVTFNQQINSITPNEDIQTEYLYYLLKVSKPIIQSFSTNSMKGMISKSTFSQIELPIAPSEQQLKFVDIFNKFSELKNKANKELFELDNLFSGLQQKVFNGTL
ncbi:restriction endonuclease subunit S [Acinetobacter haemolyticus]|uniref:restriction endonuclease subunit S n=1 Tax=Acinetobacter haemolyticus TaxID=29430 RepID=UPI001386BD2A|nr:restriction endonuclease subunit S [Acinetobacter haemolyticus]NCU24519.1 restriction endonuclease subunit S [Acinetobacter haemolyticus]